MDNATFSVLINDTVRIDGLNIGLARDRSATFGALFSLPDSEEVRMVNRGEPIPLNIACYNEDGITLADGISESLLRWLFTPFQQEALSFENPGDDSLRGCCHALQIVSFLDMPGDRYRFFYHGCLENYYWDTCFVTKALDTHGVPEVLSAIRHFYPTVPKQVQWSLVFDFSRAIEEKYFCDKRSARVQSLMVASLVLKGADLNCALDSAYQSMLIDNTDAEFYLWDEKHISLTDEVPTADDIDGLLRLSDRARLGFVFHRFLGGPAKPKGWFVLYDHDMHSFDRLIRQYVKAPDGSWERTESSIRSDGLSYYELEGSPLDSVLLPGCVRPDNPYEDACFAQEVCEALGVTLDEIKAKALE